MQGDAVDFHGRLNLLYWFRIHFLCDCYYYQFSKCLINLDPLRKAFVQGIFSFGYESDLFIDLDH